MGTPEFAAVSLRYLLDEKFEVIGVVTQPDRPKGRGLELVPSAVKTLAQQFDLPLWQPAKVDSPEFLEIFRQLNPDLVVVVAFGQKISATILFEPKFGCINVHGSLLPQYRGAAPIMWSLLKGDLQSGVTVMYMDEGWDTGDLISQASLTIDPDENFGSLYARLAVLGGESLVKTIPQILSGTADRQKQNNDLATTAFKLKPGQQEIDWTQSAQKIHNLVRALAPAPGAETYLNNERYKILETKLVDSTNFTYCPCGGSGAIQQIVKKQGILVATGDQPILITQMQPIGKRVMSAFECSNGRCLKEGMHFCK